jgi:hypothetical protein
MGHVVTLRNELALSSGRVDKISSSPAREGERGASEFPC